MKTNVFKKGIVGVVAATLVFAGVAIPTPKSEAVGPGDPENYYVDAESVVISTFYTIDYPEPYVFEIATEPYDAISDAKFSKIDYTKNPEMPFAVFDPGTIQLPDIPAASIPMMFYVDLEEIPVSDNTVWVMKSTDTTFHPVSNGYCVVHISTVAAMRVNYGSETAVLVQADSDGIVLPEKIGSDAVEWYLSDGITKLPEKVTYATFVDLGIESNILSLTSKVIEVETPTPTPMKEPIEAPTEKPIEAPTEKPTEEPTETPSPTPSPTVKPTATSSPTAKPTETPSPSARPTATPSPTTKPTVTPSPTAKPTVTPSPTAKPTATPEVKGVGSVQMKDFYYGGKPSEASVSSSTHDASKATISYKGANEDDSKYSKTVPTEVGTYVVRAVMPAKGNGEAFTVTSTFKIDYLPLPKNPYVIDTKANNAGWYNKDIKISAPEGYELSVGDREHFIKDSQKLDKDFSSKLYLRKIQTGEMTDGFLVKELKIDSVSPVVNNVNSGERYFADNFEVALTDNNEIVKVTVDGKEVPLISGQDGSVFVNIEAEKKTVTKEIIIVDIAGNETICQIMISPEWMKDGIVGEGTLYLEGGKYTFPAGAKWKISGDDTIYNGGVEFYCVNEGEYTFYRQ